MMVVWFVVGHASSLRAALNALLVSRSIYERAFRSVAEKQQLFLIGDILSLAFEIEIRIRREIDKAFSRSAKSKTTSLVYDVKRRRELSYS
ncbi:MAG: hypothetical protein C0483_16395 [Pirellula sp.]|nr:hypothetical protein [Pirellula sp.]